MRRYLAENMRRNAHKVTAANDRLVSNLVYDTTLHRIRETLLPPVPPKLRQYFDVDIEPQLHINMEVGCAEWTNNACESMNHVRTQWRLQHLPELIDKFHALVDAQYNEADRALLGLGKVTIICSQPTRDTGRHSADGKPCLNGSDSTWCQTASGCSYRQQRPPRQMAI